SVGSDEDSDDSDSEDETLSHTIHGQKWIKTPSGSKLPSLGAPISCLSFKPAYLDSTAPQGARVNSSLLIAVTSTNQIVEFDVLNCKLSEWSRRNPAALYPKAFKNSKDRIMGVWWDCKTLENEQAQKRLWLYGSSSVFMLDMAQDFSQPKVKVEKSKTIGKLGEHDVVAPDEQAGANRANIRQEKQDDGMLSPVSIKKDEDEDVDMLDEDNEDEVGALVLARRQKEQDSKASLQKEKGVKKSKPFWHTHQYRSILGAFALEQEKHVIDQPPEVVIIERPMFQGSLMHSQALWILCRSSATIIRDVEVARAGGDEKARLTFNGFALNQMIDFRPEDPPGIVFEAQAASHNYRDSIDSLASELDVNDTIDIEMSTLRQPVPEKHVRKSSRQGRDSLTHTPSESELKSKYTLAGICLAISLVSFVVQTETAVYIQHELHWNKAYCMLWLTHGSWFTLWPTQLLILRLQKSNRSQPFRVFLDAHVKEMKQVARVVQHQTLRPLNTVRSMNPWVYMASITVFIACFLTVAGGSWYVAVDLTTPSDLTAIYNCSAFFAYVFSILLLKEKMRLDKILSVALAIIGVLIVAYGDNLHPKSGSHSGGATNPNLEDDHASFQSDKRALGNLIIGIGSVMYGLYE
ncbi:hypothetical protein LTR66_016523, partial [Elasticomyces elasticus]